MNRLVWRTIIENAHRGTFSFRFLTSNKLLVPSSNSSNKQQERYSHLQQQENFSKPSSSLIPIQRRNLSSKKKKGGKIKTMAMPKLIVFDLDYTLWPFWVDTHVDPPFKVGKDGKIYDSGDHHIKHYPHVPQILSSLLDQGVKLAIASRTSAIEDGNELVRLFDWDQFFHYKQIYPGCKITHFKRIHSESNVPYQDMLFYDDEHRNIKDVSSLGVTCMFVPDGVNQDSFAEGLELFKKNRKSGSSSATGATNI